MQHTLHAGPREHHIGSLPVSQFLRDRGEECTVLDLFSKLSSLLESDQQDQQQSRPRRSVIIRCPPGPTRLLGRGQHGQAEVV